MSVLKKIGFDEVLEKLGLREDQVVVIYKNELAKLEAQEKVLLDSIDRMGAKTNDLYAERQRASQGLENERLEIAQARKHLVDEKTVITNAKNELLRVQRDTDILREKLNEDKAMFRKEKEIISQWKDEASAEKKAQEEITRSLRAKEANLDKEKDDLVLREHKVASQENFVKESHDRLEAEVKSLESAKFEANTLKEALTKSLEEVERLKEDHKSKILDGSEILHKKITDFKAEMELERDSLRRREYKVVEAEKKIEDKLADLNAQRETLAIKKSKKAVTEV